MEKVSIETHRGYDIEDKCIVTRTAVDAKTQLNPEEVKAAIENVKNVFEEQMKLIAQALIDISKDAEDAIIVQGTSMSGIIEDTATLLTQLPGEVTAGIDQLVVLAEEAHAQLQKNNNIDAYNACIVSGVTRIS